MKALLLIIGLSLMIGCASGPQILTTQASDPEYSFKNTKTIGLASFYWTKEGKSKKVDQLIEKAVLGQVKIDLELRGFKVEYLPKESLYESTSEIDGETATSISVNPTKLAGRLPELLMTVRYGQAATNTYVPAQFKGSSTVSSSEAYGHEGYNKESYDLSVSASLWAGEPKYARRVWQGKSAMTSVTPELTNKSHDLVTDLLSKVFDQQKCYYDWQLGRTVGDCREANSDRETASIPRISIGGQ
jgi:hypothetical protein